MKKVSLALLCLLPVWASCSQSPASKPVEAWNELNEPMRVDPRYQTRLAELPHTAILEKRAWAGYWWPNNRGGVSYRWFQPQSTNYFGYVPPSAVQVAAMSRAELARLSPAEKYDIYMGRFDYPTVAYERKRAKPDDAFWYGICNGRAAAAILFDEPKPVEVSGPSGIRIPFGSEDLKALVSFYHGQVKVNEGSRHVGARCDADLSSEPEEAGSEACRDTNAGAFHIVLANQLGLLKESFVIDSTRDAEVWNEPAISFYADVRGFQGPSSGAARGTVSEAIVHTRLRVSKGIMPLWNPVLGTQNQAENVELYQYRLELDANGSIIGGDWISDNRPDFMWLPKPLPFEDYFASLQQIVEAATFQ